MKPKWPTWVWVLTEEDFERQSSFDLTLWDWRVKVFGSSADSIVSNEAWLVILLEKVRLTKDCFPVLTYTQMARIWNRAMKRLGYTEVYDA